MSRSNHEFPGKCCVCGRWATRLATDCDGIEQLFCDRCPTPAEIVDRAAEVRSRWDETEHYSRQFGVCRPLVDQELAVHFDSDQRRSVGTWSDIGQHDD